MTAYIFHQVWSLETVTFAQPSPPTLTHPVAPQTVVLAHLPHPRRNERLTPEMCQPQSDRGFPSRVTTDEPPSFSARVFRSLISSKPFTCHSCLIPVKHKRAKMLQISYLFIYFIIVYYIDFPFLMDSITCKLLLDGILGACVDHLAFKWGILRGPGQHNKRSDHLFHTSI